MTGKNTLARTSRAVKLLAMSATKGQLSLKTNC